VAGIGHVADLAHTDALEMGVNAVWPNNLVQGGLSVPLEGNRYSRVPPAAGSR
jgi:hypothetical protein